MKTTIQHNHPQSTYTRNTYTIEHPMKPQDLATLARAALMPAGFRHHDSGEPAQPAAVTATQAIAAKVDRLGVLHAAQAEMKREAVHLRAELEDAGLEHIEGNLYRVNFAQVAGRTLIDWQAIATKLKPSPQLIRAHTTTGAPSARMTVKARPTH